VKANVLSNLPGACFSQLGPIVMCVMVIRLPIDVTMAMDAIEASN
jgi:hypothetical protein